MEKIIKNLKKQKKNKFLNRLVFKNCLLIFLCLSSCSSKEKIILINYHKEISKSTNDQMDNEQCVEWQLDSTEIIEILTNSEITSFNEIDVRCSTLPCEYTGSVIFKGKHFDFWINAGGYTTLQNKKEDKVFLIYDKKNKLFLDTLWRPQNE